QIVTRIENAGFKILAVKLIRMSHEDAAGFYVVHTARPFYRSLCTFMTQGPCLPMVLEGDNVIQRWRELMGATDPAKAAPGTIRRDFAASTRSKIATSAGAPIWSVPRPGTRPMTLAGSTVALATTSSSGMPRLRNFDITLGSVGYPGVLMLTAWMSLEMVSGGAPCCRAG